MAHHEQQTAAPIPRDALQPAHILVGCPSLHCSDVPFALRRRPSASEYYQLLAWQHWYRSVTSVNNSRSVLSCRSTIARLVSLHLSRCFSLQAQWLPGLRPRMRHCCMRFSLGCKLQSQVGGRCHLMRHRTSFYPTTCLSSSVKLLFSPARVLQWTFERHFHPCKGSGSTVIVGHDTNLDGLATLLDLEWTAPPYLSHQLYPTPPGAALRFRLDDGVLK